MHTISQYLGTSICQSLPAFHALTGCDTTSCITGLGKKKPWKTLKRKLEHQTTLNLLGQQQYLDDTTASKIEAFICDLYPVSRRNSHTLDELRYLMFCQQRHKRKNEVLPPTSDSLKQHVKRANYQTYIWRGSLVPMLNLTSPNEHGWEIEDGYVRPFYMTKEPAPSSLLELTTCNCNKSHCQGNCSCSNIGLSCTEACSCMGDETCSNPHTLHYLSESDSDVDSDDNAEGEDAR